MKTAFLFPGQGSQRVGMGRDLAARFARAAALFEQADDLLGFGLSGFCFDGSAESLTSTEVQQPALFVVGMARWAVLQGREAHIDFFAGHSLGTISALTAAGCLSFADGLRLVAARGQLMHEAGEQRPGGMSAVLGLSAETVSEVCRSTATETGKIVALANDNSPLQQVIAGEPHALEVAEAAAKSAGARKVVRLAISIGSHCALMDNMATEFAAIVGAIPVQPPQTPVMSNVSGRPLQTVEEAKTELVAQLTKPVRWTKAMRYLREAGVERFVEVGPGDVLTKLMKRIDRSAVREVFVP